jgi:hypothetical protein
MLLRLPTVLIRFRHFHLLVFVRVADLPTPPDLNLN